MQDNEIHRRSPETEVDEREIFKGSENNLTMTQTYTHKFQCQYQLEKYPFDKQVQCNSDVSR